MTKFCTGILLTIIFPVLTLSADEPSALVGRIKTAINAKDVEAAAKQVEWDDAPAITCTK